KEKSAQFKKDLDNAWKKIDEATKTIVATHSKSLCRVETDLHLGHGRLCLRKSRINSWNAFCWKMCRENTATNNENTALKQEILLQLVKNNKEKYHKLSDDAKQGIVREFTEFKVTKAIGVRISARSRINDITQTLKVMENELNNLKSHTGVETILYTTRGMTDLPLWGIPFATEGVEDFMGMVMGVDTQDLVSKMEGFAVQGIRGVVKNHQQHVSQVRAAIREIINHKLQEVTRDPKAKMQWTHYFHNVVQRYMAVIIDWPDSVPFANLSNASSSLSQLEILLHKWEMGTIYWKTLAEGEYNKLLQKRNEQLESGELSEVLHRTRSDKGKKRKCHSSEDVDGVPSCNKKYKCAQMVRESDDKDSTT
ncbi:hypothetical protein BDN67DRAFT_872571, partial [Paxillus ammoniavirescens]